ncbi:FAD dependent oxidoreductase protein [Rutstroemia sp. NJR-2017a BBW]|nr:FAD dependent oxidoreductase protein [Rutstroemia sp. NJR-2017a BBW]
MSSTYQPPKSILFVGTSLFSLSTTLSLLRRPLYAQTTITLLDRSPFPSPDASSVDSSRIIRADYSDPYYSALAASAQEIWRQNASHELGGQGRYTESGLCLTCDTSYTNTGAGYVGKSYENVKGLMQQAGDTTGVQELPSKADISKQLGTGPGSGEWGYINHRSGWANAEASLVWLRNEVERLSAGRVTFVTAEATSLIFSASGTTVLGAHTTDGTRYHADLTILSAGAWSGKFLDLRSQVHASGQCLLFARSAEYEHGMVHHSSSQ